MNIYFYSLGLKHITDIEYFLERETYKKYNQLNEFAEVLFFPQ